MRTLPTPPEAKQKGCCSEERRGEGEDSVAMEPQLPPPSNLHMRSASVAQNMSWKSLSPTDHSVRTPRPVHPVHCTNADFRLKEGK